MFQVTNTNYTVRASCAVARYGIGHTTGHHISEENSLK